MYNIQHCLICRPPAACQFGRFHRYFRWSVHGIKPKRGADSQKTDLAALHGQETEQAVLQAAVLPVAGGQETEAAALQAVAGGQETEKAALQAVAGGQEKEAAGHSLCMISYFGLWIRDQGSGMGKKVPDPVSWIRIREEQPGSHFGELRNHFIGLNLSWVDN
jgi:hypothetical protein